MGNDIKLPGSHLKEHSESKKASEAEARTQLNHEIEKMLQQLKRLNCQIDIVEDELRLINVSLRHYSTLIKDMYKDLYKLQEEQIGASLTHENYVEKCKWYLEKLNMIEQEETRLLNNYPVESLLQMEARIKDLTHEVEENNKFIDQQT